MLVVLLSFAHHSLCLFLSFCLSVGSLLETPYPCSPGTSPEPISPVMPLASPETPYPISQVALSQSVVSVKSFNTDSVASDTGSIALGQIFTTGPGDCPTQTMTSDCRSHSPPKSTFITEVTEHLNSFTESVFSYGLKCDNSNAGHSTSTAETFTVTAGSSRLDASICCTPSNAAPGPLTFITRSINTGAESTSSTGPTTSKWEQITSTPVPALFSVSTCARERVPNPDLLESLEKLAQRGDDTHLPEYLHQVTCLCFLWHTLDPEICMSVVTWNTHRLIGSLSCFCLSLSVFHFGQFLLTHLLVNHCYPFNPIIRMALCTQRLGCFQCL